MSKASDSLVEQVARTLAERIVRGELKAADRLREVHVAQQLGVSRGAVREALLVLRRWHLVDIQANRGAQVSALTAEHVRGLYRLALELHVLLANTVIDNWQQPADLAPFREIRARLGAALQEADIQVFVDGSQAITRTACVMARNPFVEQTLENLLPVFNRTHHLTLASRRQRMEYFLDAYSALLQAVEQRDRRQARQVLERYMQSSCDLALAAISAPQGAGSCA